MMELILKIVGLIFTYLFYYYLVALAYLIYTKITKGGNAKRHLNEKKLMIVFGSGGHTTEMLLMLTKKVTH